MSAPCLADTGTDAPHYQDEAVTLHHGDCLTVLRAMPDESVHAVVCDPPYGLSDVKPAQVIAALTGWAQGDRERVPDARGFMGRSWDAFVPPPAVWDECLRVLKPGGHLVAFAGTRTMDLMGLSIRMAGFEIRDGIGAALPPVAGWVYGSGFPKGQNVSKAIDATLLHGKANSAGLKATNASRPGEGRIAPQITNNGHMGESVPGSVTRDQPATREAAAWQGWNTSLKPSWEPILVCRKPLSGTVAATILAHGTGGLNIAATRVGNGPRPDDSAPRGRRPRGMGETGERTGDPIPNGPTYAAGEGGRWPSNVLFSHGDCDDTACQPGCPVADLDAQSAGTRAAKPSASGSRSQAGDGWGMAAMAMPQVFTDSGGASRFFPVFRYQAKAPGRERPKVNGVAHVSVKPLELMKWLVRLVTPPGGTILEPFAGSGTTLEAALLEGFHVIGVEREADYLPLIGQRIQRAHAQLATTAAQATPAPGLFDVPTHAATSGSEPAR